MCHHAPQKMPLGTFTKINKAAAIIWQHVKAM
jgi:hypothetical protein